MCLCLTAARVTTVHEYFERLSRSSGLDREFWSVTLTDLGAEQERKMHKWFTDTEGLYTSSLSLVCSASGLGSRVSVLGSRGRRPSEGLTMQVENT